MTTSEGSLGHASQAGQRASLARQLPAGARDVLLYALIAVLVWAMWALSRQGLFRAGDRVGYWLGVTGGVMMLLLFSYPLRKHVKALHGWGKAKWWLWAHMVLGLGGPLLILLHSTFHIGSTNAGVALYSMLVVAGSGIVGRFLYLRVNRGLHGEQSTLRELQVRAGFDQDDARSRLAFAPDVEERLRAFEREQLRPGRNAAGHLRQLVLLPLQQWLAYRKCSAGLRAPLQRLAQQRRWSPTQLAERERLARKLVRRYLNAVARVAQFSIYERLFALWHVAHVPFVYLLVLSAVAHVVAVHAY